MESAVSFVSDGLTLSGIVHTPDGLQPGERRPAFLLLHGFGTSKISTTMTEAAEMLVEFGYIVLRFDMRGCGESEGEPARILCLDQVEDTQNALTYMASRDDVEAGLS